MRAQDSEVVSILFEASRKRATRKFDLSFDMILNLQMCILAFHRTNINSTC